MIFVIALLVAIVALAAWIVGLSGYSRRIPFPIAPRVRRLAKLVQRCEAPDRQGCRQAAGTTNTRGPGLQPRNGPEIRR